MLESLEALKNRPFNPAATPQIDADGRISLPGFPQGFSLETYLPLVNLHARILEANRILDRYRAQLRQEALCTSCGKNFLNDVGCPCQECNHQTGDRGGDEYELHTRPEQFEQTPLTALQTSSLLPNLFYKREDQTVTRAYKVRGAVVGMAKAMVFDGAILFLAIATMHWAC